MFRKEFLPNYLIVFKTFRFYFRILTRVLGLNYSSNFPHRIFLIVDARIIIAHRIDTIRYYFDL